MIKLSFLPKRDIYMISIGDHGWYHITLNILKMFSYLIIQHLEGLMKSDHWYVRLMWMASLIAKFCIHGNLVWYIKCIKYREIILIVMSTQTLAPHNHYGMSGLTVRAPPCCEMSGLSHSYCSNDKPVTTTPPKYLTSPKSIPLPN